MKDAPLFLEIALPLPLNRIFTYRLPSLWKGPPPEVGSRVLAPFSGRIMTGWVVAHTDRPAPGIKPVPLRAVIDQEPVVSPEFLDLCRWVAGYYLGAMGEVLRGATPPALRSRVRTRISLLEPEPEPEGGELFPEARRVARPRGPIQRAVVEALESAGGSASLGSLGRAVRRRSLSSTLKSLESQNIVRVDQESVVVQERRVRWLVLREERPATHSGLGPRGRELVALLESEGGEIPTARLQREFGFSAATLQSVVRRNWADFDQRVRSRLGDLALLSKPRSKIISTDAQSQAISELRDALDTGEFREFLLHGVTGSGKTHVYLEAARAARAAGRTVLVLVPEIALTPSIVTDLDRVFPGEVALLHSGLGEGERHDAWLEIARGNRPVVVAVRSGVFAPLRDIGLIVIDEEHESAYKHEGAVPYDARVVARHRAETEGAVIVMGSATPSVDAYARAQAGNVHLLELPERIDSRPLPSVEVIDMMREMKGGNRSAFSSVLRERIRERLDEGEQVVLLLNRRGFAPSIQCSECGDVPECSSCAVRLSYHRQDDRMRCHYCGAESAMPVRCGACGAEGARFRGRGTQRVEEELAQAFPSARVARLDQDATRLKESHVQILESFVRGETDILLGTQMVAKGLDVPSVTLVGVINADVGLSMPDFRAGERTFQLLTQVAGRAGRGEALGEVVIQTWRPEHSAVIRARSHDFHGFFHAECGIRQDLGYPPYGRLILLVARGPDEDEVWRSAEALGELLRLDSQRVAILGPAAAPIFRAHGDYRVNLLLKADRLEDARDLVERAKEKWEVPKGIRIRIDVDPLRFV